MMIPIFFLLFFSCRLIWSLIHNLSNLLHFLCPRSNLFCSIILQKVRPNNSFSAFIFQFTSKIWTFICFCLLNKLKHLTASHQMGLSLSIILSAWNEILQLSLFALVELGMSNGSDKIALERSISFKKWKLPKPELEMENLDSISLESKANPLVQISKPTILIPQPVILFSPKPLKELDAAAIKLQKVYKSYRTRRNLADCAVVVEELWFVTLSPFSILLYPVWSLFFN